MKIKTLNKIAKDGLNLLGDGYEVVGEEYSAGDVDGIMLRSFKMHDYPFEDSLKAIARAGAGTNNIPIPACTEKGIVVFNTPGANANGVNEMVLTGMLLACRDVLGATKWVNEANMSELGVAKSVEKNKSKFKGPELKGKTLAIIGLGAIGVLVANTAISLGMEVVGYDPYMTLGNALSLNAKIKIENDINDIYKEADFISIHIPLMEQTKNTINKESFVLMKDGVNILNFARGGLVDEAALKKAIDSGRVNKYVTDFPNENVLGYKNVICIPHLGASTVESEINCAVMAAVQVKDFLENGNIVNSVNAPGCSLGTAEKGKRISVLFSGEKAKKCVDDILNESGNSVKKMASSSKGDLFYGLYDFADLVRDEVVNKLNSCDGVLKARLI